VVWNKFHPIIRVPYSVMEVKEWALVNVVKLCIFNVTFNGIVQIFT